jgi:hypothetical protein
MKNFFKPKKVKMDPEISNRIIQDLILSINIIGNESKWTKRALARNSKDERLFDPNDIDAVSWDILGVLHKVNAIKQTFTYLRLACKSLGYEDIDRFNDFNDHKAILSFFKGALQETSFETKEKK